MKWKNTGGHNCWEKKNCPSVMFQRISLKACCIHFQRKNVKGNRYLRNRQREKELAISVGNVMVGWHKHKHRLAQPLQAAPCREHGTLITRREKGEQRKMKSMNISGRKLIDSKTLARASGFMCSPLTTSLFSLSLIWFFPLRLYPPYFSAFLFLPHSLSSPLQSYRAARCPFVPAFCHYPNT